MKCLLPISVVLLLAAPAGACAHRRSSAEAELHRALGHTSITVYPTVVRMGRTAQPDLDSARQLAKAFEQRGLGKAAVREDPLLFPIQGSFNQAKMYRQSKAAFSEHIRTQPPPTPYAALAEYLLTTHGRVGGIHLYVVRSDGTPVTGILLNSHWKEFRQVKPASVQDATRALMLRLSNQWKPATS